MLVALIKPQFEVEKSEVGDKGVVSDTKLHERVCAEIKEWLNNQDGWEVIGITKSPIKGPEGNIEFLIFAEKNKLIYNLFLIIFRCLLQHLSSNLALIQFSSGTR